MSTTSEYNKGLIKYSSRDYNSLLEEFYSIVPTLTDLWSPDADADPGVVLGKFLASVGDMLSTNLDNQANELYAPSVKQRKNAEKLFGLIGYVLGWWTAARTEVTFTNDGETDIKLDFGFNGANWATLNAYTDITNNSRTLTYNVLPMTNSYGAGESRSTRSVLTSSIDVFTDTDEVTLAPGESCTRVAIEGELRNYSVSVAQVKANNYVITLPSQHVDTTAVWIMAKSNLSDDAYLSTNWMQCESVADFITPEPRFAVTYDNYSNAQVTISNYLNQLENYDSNWLCIYWVDTSGAVGCVSEDVLSNLLLAKDSDQDTTNVSISNLSNVVELPNTYTVTGDSPETSKEAYFNSRNYINTYDSLVTLPDYTRFLNREAGVDCGVVIDCQKALEINMAIYEDENLTDSQKSKMYITNYDFPEGSLKVDWAEVLDLDFDPTDPQKFVFAANFRVNTAMCFAIHNDFQASSYGRGVTSNIQVNNLTKFMQYKPPQMFIDGVLEDYRPLQSLAVEMKFGYARIFKFYAVGTIHTVKPVSTSVGANIIAKVKEALALFYAPANRNFGEKPTLMEIVDVVESADDRIKYFDAGSLNTDCIVWVDSDPEYFNPISFARFADPGTSSTNIRISPSCLVD